MKRLVILVAALMTLAGGRTLAEVPEKPWDVRPVLVGTTVPDVSFVDGDGPFSLRERASVKPLILVVYRGLW